MSYAHQLLCIYLFSIMHPTLPTSISNNIVSETGFTNSRMTSNKAQINECENVNCCLHPLEILLYRCIFFFFVNIELFMPVLTRSSGNDCNSCIIRGFKHFFFFRVSCFFVPPLETQTMPPKLHKTSHATLISEFYFIMFACSTALFKYESQNDSGWGRL